MRRRTARSSGLSHWVQLIENRRRSTSLDRQTGAKALLHLAKKIEIMLLGLMSWIARSSVRSHARRLCRRASETMRPFRLPRRWALSIVLGTILVVTAEMPQRTASRRQTSRRQDGF